MWCEGRDMLWWKAVLQVSKSQRSLLHPATSYCVLMEKTPEAFTGPNKYTPVIQGA